MHDRLDLQEMLCDILGSGNVYFSPPESVKLQYPAIIYSLSNINNKYAENTVYAQFPGYQIIVVDKDVDSIIAQKISRLPRCRFDRYYVSDNLAHFVFTLY